MSLDTEAASVLAKWAGTILGGIGTMFGLHKWRENRADKLNERFEEKADKVDLRELFHIFREHESRDRDRHDELIKTINANHVSLLERIGK